MTEGSIWTVLLSGIVGILLGGLVQAAVSRYATFKEGKAIGSAIRAEIETVIRIWDRAKYDEAIDRNLKHLEVVRRPTHNDVFAIVVNPKVFQVFDSVCHKIGLLGDLSPEIVGFYALGKALVTNIGILWDIRERLIARKITIERDALLDLTRQVHQLSLEFQQVGTRTASALAVHERRRWSGVFH